MTDNEMIILLVAMNIIGIIMSGFVFVVVIYYLRVLSEKADKIESHLDYIGMEFQRAVNWAQNS